jgi:hypothetical protein
MRVSLGYIAIGLASLAVGAGWGIYFVWYEFPAYASNLYSQCARNGVPCAPLAPATSQPALAITEVLAALGVVLIASGWYLSRKDRPSIEIPVG